MKSRLNRMGGFATFVGIAVISTIGVRCYLQSSLEQRQEISRLGQTALERVGIFEREPSPRLRKPSPHALCKGKKEKRVCHASNLPSSKELLLAALFNELSKDPRINLN